jgi:hypothetical protein
LKRSIANSGYPIRRVSNESICNAIPKRFVDQ